MKGLNSLARPRYCPGMATNPKRIYRTRNSAHNSLVISGNMRLFVSKGDLHIHYGYGKNREERVFTHADRHKPEQIILHGSDFQLTGEALMWCRNAQIKTRKSTRRGIAVLQCERGNRPRIMPEFQMLVTPEPTKDRPDIRTYQVRAAFDLRDTLGLDIHRYVIAEKIRGQADVLRSHFGGLGSNELYGLADAAETGESHKDIRTAESSAATIYFKVWEETGLLLWNPVDVESVPDEWLRFSGRRSALTDSNKRAEDPVNAALNFAYAVAKAETALAMRAQFMDPALGIDHMVYADKDRQVPDRPDVSVYGGALDLVEALRPEVDRLVLDWLASTPLGPDDAVQHRSYATAVSGKECGVPGQCSLGSMPMRAISDLGPVMYDAVAGHVEHVARMLHDAAGSPVNLPSRLTKANHKKMNAKRKARKAA